MDERRPFSSFILGRVFHGQRIGSRVFTSKKNAIDETQEQQQRDASDPPGFIAQQQPKKQGNDREATHGNNRDLSPAELVPVMAKDRCSHRAAYQGQRKNNVEQR